MYNYGKHCNVILKYSEYVLELKSTIHRFIQFSKKIVELYENDGKLSI